MSPFFRLLPFLALAACPTQAAEDDEPAFGHSVHGEVFNEGPRQAAVFIAGTGDVQFAVTTESSEAQQFFDQGIGQLHGFWDFEAERSFRQVASIDPDCAMAYWGMAMANFKNNERGKGFIDEAVARKDSASNREQAWITGLAEYFKDPKADLKKRLRSYVRTLEDLATEHPEDIEAQAFLLKQIYYNHGKELAIPSHYAVNLLVEKILATDPNHPANHYQIHLWDKEKPERALPAAAACGPAAPGIAHMWHMPGHTYSKLKRYHDAVWQQEASARVDHAHMIRFQIVPDQIHNFAHNNEWCIRNMNFLGEFDRSIELASNMMSLPRLAKFKDKKDESTYDPKGSSWQYGRQRLRDTLIRFEQWDRFIAETESGILQPDEKSIKQREVDHYLGIAKFETGDIEGAASHLSVLEKDLDEKTTSRDAAVEKAKKKASESGKDESGIKTAGDAAAKTFKSDIESLQKLVNELKVYAALCSNPPDITVAKDLLADLKDLPKWRHANLWHRAGDEDNALKLAEEAATGGESEVLPLAMQVKLLHSYGKTEAAREAFNQLRSVASTADLNTPPLAALTEAAAEFEFPADWRIPAEPSSDLGERPAHDSLGPFQWSPQAAKGFSLSDSNGKITSLSDFKGKPVLVIFFLGRGCTHCMEQLNAFAPLTEAYADAGIDIVAISTDSIDGLAQTFQGTEGGDNPFPFALLSDESHDTFKAYRAFDDFEKMDLHGTFLIDGSQQIRWHDINFEPFMHPQWLLEEAIRILALKDQ